MEVTSMPAVNNAPAINGFEASKIDVSTPILILGGRENSLSLVRRFGAAGIKTRVSGPSDCWGMYSRHCAEHFKIPRGASGPEYWNDLLLSGKNPQLHGSLLIAGSDLAIEFMAENRTALEAHFVFAHGDPKLQLSLLDKRETLILAKQAGVATPQFWNVANEDDLENIRGSVEFPVMVKPILSHNFIKQFGKKLFIIEKDFDELAGKVRLAWSKNIEVMVIEMIPGPDSQLSSFYTYIDGDDQIRFEYTKRIIRRYPINRGLACYHKSEWMPETAEAGKKFFKGIGFQGLGNIEFKRDPRDNILKVIESNARFTAAQELVVQAGAPIDFIFYCAATGQPAPTFEEYDQQLTYWYGVRDFLAFLEMRMAGSISTEQWIKSLFPLKHVPPLHSVSDPYPSFAAFSARLDKTVRSLI